LRDGKGGELEETRGNRKEEGGDLKKKNATKGLAEVKCLAQGRGEKGTVAEKGSGIAQKCGGSVCAMAK